MSDLKTRPLPAIDQDVVLGVCLLMHDEKCYQRDLCPRRDRHALECYEKEVRKILGLEKIVAGDAT